MAHGASFSREYRVLTLGGDWRVGWNDNEGWLSPRMAHSVHCSPGGLTICADLRWGQSDFNLVARERLALIPEPADRAQCRGRRDLGPPPPSQPHAATSSVAITAGAGRAAASQVDGTGRPRCPPPRAVACVHRGGGPARAPTGVARLTDAPPLRPTRDPRRCAPPAAVPAPQHLACAQCERHPASASVLPRRPRTPRCSRQRRPSGRDGHHNGGWRGGYRGVVGSYLASPAPTLPRAGARL